jgi:hypothetical protein
MRLNKVSKEITTIQLIDFKDPTSLTKWVKWLSYFGIFASLFALIAGYMEFEFFNNFTNDLYSTEDLATQAEDFKDNFVGTAAAFQLFGILQIIAFSLLVYRLNFNTHALGVENMKFTPGWSVGWFFIPIAHLWKPYQTLKEIWNKNQFIEVSGLSEKRSAKFIGLFWAFFILSNSLGWGVLRLSLKATELPQLMMLNKLTLLSDLMEIPCYVMTIILVERLCKVHMQHFATRSQAYELLMSGLPAEEREARSQSKWVQRTLVTLLVIFIILSIVMMIGALSGSEEG